MKKLDFFISFFFKKSQKTILSKNFSLHYIFLSPGEVTLLKNIIKIFVYLIFEIIIVLIFNSFNNM
jgi:hypothetical protein